MFFGLPLRTTNTTTELVTKPSYSFWFQSVGDQARRRPGVSMSGSSEKRDDVGRQAGLDRARLVAGGAVGLVEARRPCRAVVFLKAGMSSS